LKKQAEINFRDEIDVPRNELDVHGRCDGICQINDQAIVVEFKSINKNIVYEPKEEHVGQLTWYMGMWKKLRDDLKEDFGFDKDAVVRESDLVGMEGASGRIASELNDIERWLIFTQGEMRGEIIYESKSTNQTYHFPIIYDEAMFKKVQVWFQQLEWHVKHKQFPAVRYDKTLFPCQWGSGATFGRCAYYEHCWGK
jgi:hypothetical protein